ncbi:MAG: TonB family protein [Elusimicrobiota bacterium]
MTEYIEAEYPENALIKGIEGTVTLKILVDTDGRVVIVKIRKISSPILRGPAVIEVGNTKIAIGRGMAQKIIIEIEK